jgi:hypothetical protein
MARLGKGFNFSVNKLKIRIPLLIEVESEGVIPVLGAIGICLIIVCWIALG